MKDILRPLIGHGHNFATRCWFMTVFAVYWFHRLSVKNPELQSVITGLNKELFYLGLACIGIIFLAGWGRSLYPNNVQKIFDKAREKERIKQLSKMYLILFAVFFTVFCNHNLPEEISNCLCLGGQHSSLVHYPYALKMYVRIKPS